MGGGNSSSRTLSMENSGANDVSVTSKVDPATEKASVSGKGQVDVSELKKLEAYYEERISAIEKQNAELYKATVAHFSEAVQQVEKKYLKTSLPLICGEQQQAVKNCLIDNRHQSLKCSAEVHAFNNCVLRQQQRILAK